MSSKADAKIIRYQLATMSMNPPDPSDPFIPDYNLNGAPPIGITYGVDLSVSSYSATLQDIIQECLYERPTFRPVTTELKRRIANNIQACVAAGAQPEPWGDYLPAEPLPPGIAIPPSGPTLVARRAFRQAKAFTRRLMREDRQRQPLTRRQRDMKIRRMDMKIRRRCNHVKTNNKQCGNKFPTTRLNVERYCKLHRA